MSAIREPGEVGTPSEADRGLRGSMGVVELVFTVLAYNGPVVVFLGFIPVLILLGNGLGTPVTIVACGLVMSLVAAALITVTKQLDRPGGFYAIITAGLGRVAGLGAGFTALTCYFFAVLSVYGLGGVALGGVVTEFLAGPDLPWWVWAYVMLIVTAVLGYFNISFSAKVLTYFLLAELLLLIAYNISVTVQGGENGFGFDSFTFDAISSGSLSIALLFGVGLFGGFEATVIFRDEVRDPDRTIPRATFGVIGLLAGVYGLTAWVFINSYGAAVIMDVLNADLAGAAQTSVREYTGELAYDLATIMLFTSAFALTLAAHNIAARYIFNLGADGILPSSLGQAHPRHVSPHRASLVLSVISAVVVAVLAVMNIDEGIIYARLAGVYSYAFLMLLVVVSFALAAILMRNPSVSHGALKAIGSLVSGVILAVALVLATKNFTLLTGAEGVNKVALLALIWVITMAGLVAALILKIRKPEVYARIGRQ